MYFEMKIRSGTFFADGETADSRHAIENGIMLSVRGVHTSEGL